MKNLITALTLTTALLIANTASAERLFSVETSGFMFKDKINVEVFDDPTIDGISCYIALPDKALSFDDQSDTSLACRQVGPIDKTALRNENDVFSKSKGIFFKSMRVDRYWDASRNVMVYISYTKKMSGDNASSGLSVVVVK